MKRFPDLDKLASFVGLIPATVSSAEKASNLGIKNQHNRYLRNLLNRIRFVWKNEKEYKLSVK